MERKIRYVIFWMMLLPFAASAQKDTLSKQLDSLNQLPPEVKRGNRDSIRQEFYNQKTKINFPVYWKLMGSDIKQQVTSPFHAKPRDWYRTAAVVTITGGVLMLDKPISRAAVNWRNSSTAMVNTSKYVTRFGGPYEIITLASLGAYGWVFKNEKIKTTTLLATQAYISSAVIFEAVKFLSGRQRPYNYNPDLNSNKSLWHGPFYQFRKDADGNKPNSSSYTSFPSGHTTLAFAAATVFAMEYSDRPFVKIFAYSAASIVGLSRITENKHWASDVLIGGILGHLVGRQVVNNYHRFAKLKSEQGAIKKKNTLSFAPQYLYGKLLPGMVYKFN